MKKIIRLTETDLTRLVRRVIKEQESPFAQNPISKSWFDRSDREIDEPTNYSDEKTFGPEDYDSFMEYINDCDTMWCLKTKKFYDMYAKEGGIKVRK